MRPVESATTPTLASHRTLTTAATELRGASGLGIKRASLFLLLVCMVIASSSLPIAMSFTVRSNERGFHCQRHHRHGPWLGPSTKRDICDCKPSSSSSSTSLSGVRSSLRNRFSRLSQKLKRDQTHAPPQLVVTNESTSTTSDIRLADDAPTNCSFSHHAVDDVVDRSPVASSFQTVGSNNVATTTTTSMESNIGGLHSTPAIPSRRIETQQQVVSTESLYHLPPIESTRQLTKLEIEFRDMLEHFTNYSERDLLSLRDPRMRTLFRGVAASAVEPAVYRAFEVLYEDLYPLRLAGRLVYKMLKDLMIQSQIEREEEVQLVVSKTGLDRDDVEATRLAFVSVAAELNGDAFLTLSQLAKIEVLTDVAVNILNFDSVEQLLQRLNEKNLQQPHHGKLYFVDMVIGLRECAEEMCGLEACNPTAVMQDIMYDLKEHPPSAHNDALDEKRRRFSERYDEMLTAFQEWEDFIPEGHGRRIDVVKGCFVGARNPPVVDALRIVYADFSPLRVAGDIIFKLVSGVMRARQRHQQNHHHNHHHP